MPIAGRASADIEAPIDTVWQVVRDVERWPEWQGTLGRLDALARDADGRVSRCQIQVDATVRTITLELAVSYDAPRGLSWRREGGDLKNMEGSWELEELATDRTRATYVLEVEPGRVLGMFINASVQESLRGTLVDTRPGELKTHVEGG